MSSEDLEGVIGSEMSVFPHSNEKNIIAALHERGIFMRVRESIVRMDPISRANRGPSTDP